MGFEDLIAAIYTFGFGVATLGIGLAWPQILNFRDDWSACDLTP
jgi:hypothetical protein